MLYTYTDTIKTYNTEDNVVFNTTKIQTGCTVTHDAGQAVINLNRPGFYMVHFNVSASAADSAGVLQFALFNNGIEVDGAEGSAYSQGTGDIENIGFTALIRVKPNVCACDTSCMHTSLYIRNTGVESIVQTSAVTITKIA